MKILITLLCVAVLAGCASSPDQNQYDSWARAVEAQHNYAVQAAAGCQTDLCRYVVTQEVAGNTIRAPQKQVSPGWQVLDRVLSIGLPAYFGVRQSEVWAGALTGVTQSFAGMDGSYTNNSVSVGGDQIGGSRVDDKSVVVGRDQVGGDQWHGDRYNDSCVGDACRNRSPVDNSSWADNSDGSTTDNSNNSDNSDNSSSPAVP
ncbi:hypothetical protein [uncultured Gilvimarinus sp.]|uniref:hypothetical protein n=1 Tax=uncultured Gilvimarinus sp. TaxID=1689143 RepID=UPI0030DBF12D